MKYTMTTPCDECPFLLGSGFTHAALSAHASGEFACHRACKIGRGGYFEARNDKTPHCAGALIFLEKQKNQHQMMRICRRIGLYDPTKLDMTAKVVDKPTDCPMAD